MKNKLIPITLFLFVLVIGCTDIIVPDIREDSTALITPQDNLSTDVQSHTLKWEAVNFADGYFLEIVEPSFDSILRFIHDSDVDSNRFDFTFPVGTYQWRVTPFNQAYDAQTSEIFSLTISSEAGDNLSDQTLDIITPEAELCTKNSTFTFAWSALVGADTYTLQIGNEDFTQITRNVELTETSYTTVLSSDAVYYWRVRAENQGLQSFTTWQTRRFTLDQTAPTAPILTSPSNQDTLSLSTDNLVLEWNPATDAELDTLYIYADLLRDTLLLIQPVTETTYDLNQSNLSLEIEDYYWQLRSIDKPGNTSEYSQLRVFTLE
jgi:hypothetical protein